VWVIHVVIVVMVVVMVSGSERRARKHRQKQGSEENLFHGLNVARSPSQCVGLGSLRIKKGNRSNLHIRAAHQRKIKGQ
jgi:hypothetical protein